MMRVFLTTLLLAFGLPLYAEDVAVFAKDLRLAGTYEDGTKAAALIISGSGPTDRHGNSAAGLSTDAYALLAQGLAGSGIASIRADKRGIGGSTGNGNAVTLAEYASDAGRWIDALKQRTGQACIWLIGHSEGGLISLHTAQSREDLCGLVLLATPGRGFDEILMEQLGAAPAMAPHLADTRAFLNRLKAGETVAIEDMPVPLAPIFPPAVHDYMKDLLAFDPIEVAAKADVPALVVQGGLDLQVTMTDAAALHDALPQSSLVSYQDMTHMLKDADGSQEANIATYTDHLLPLTDGLTAVISDFITQ